jgi:TRAP-type C4-dicarboxylate transport system permease small subunit
MKSIFKIVRKIVDVLNSVFLSIMVIVLGAQVFFRYVLNSPLGWSEEVGRATLVWITFFGSFAAFTDDKHMRITLLYNKFSDSTKRKVKIFGNIAVIVLN